MASNYLDVQVYNDAPSVPSWAWVVCSSRTESGGVAVEFVLSVTEGCLDSYPLFMFTTLPTHHLTQEFVEPRMEQMVMALLRNVPVKRVYAVYGPDLLARVFARNWTQITGIQNLAHSPYYAAKLSFCTRQTFRNRAMALRADLTYEIRPADNNDIRDVAECCGGFADDSAPYSLTWDGAIREATFLVGHHQVWIHRIAQKGTSRSEIASIVAFTRNSETNATITKVYTNPKWRRLGCAERLVRKVCEYLLQSKVTVSLFVAHDNPGAALVYSRVGFVGLGPQEGFVPGVEGWTEIGFDRNFVQLGHW
ncbi:hypothetical protein P691DRAFT_792720 [Macrolepiota fuliginosa MF-IS2]|uniref:N-acetyltransferase domain-containing protein n=1 Tax=Macrolepiota fuliginosa MF-IS2 TaxID=1400762 RepID=A0A9P5XBD9_9AGAR|nr:hypothetical protein P691DRAFT_792720 [Macrolepiota fuliginosa MF-IS2]